MLKATKNNCQHYQKPTKIPQESCCGFGREISILRKKQAKDELKSKNERKPKHTSQTGEKKLEGKI